MVTLLERHFGQLVDYEFTARMEGVLDEIAHGEAARVPWLRRFYFGGDEPGATGPDGDGANGNGISRRRTGLKALVSDIDDIDPREVSSFPLDGTDITVRVGRYGPYLERDGQRVNVPEDMAPDELTPERAEELFSQPNEDRLLGTDPDTGLPGGREVRPVRPVRDRAAARGRAGVGQAAHRLAAEVDVAGHGDAGRRAAAAQPAAGHR